MTAEKPIIMTLMVRDEADVIAAMIEHHLAQGIDLIIATDNASTDGTREILSRYAELGVVELHDDPRLEKQQAEVVTAMARRAYTEHGAAWVINADADEFWFASSGDTVADALAKVPASVQSFDARVRNLVGEPMESGSVLATHVWRDERSDEALHAVGLHAHPTQDCVHRGSAHVTVQQGNHGTSLPLSDKVSEASALEVLHVPYRQWSRYQERVRNTAAAYERSGLSPSPRHHGMRDARWLEEGVLRPMFVARHAAAGATSGLAKDTRVVDSLSRLLDEKRALIPELVEAALEPGEPLPGIDDDLQLFQQLGPWLVRESEARADLAYRDQDFYSMVAKNEAAEAHQEQLVSEHRAAAAAHQEEVRGLHEKLAAADASVRSLTEYVERLLSNRLLRATARVTTPRYGWNERVAKAKRALSSLTQRFMHSADQTEPRASEVWQSNELQELSRNHE